METDRFEALIDAILAIIITLIVLEISLPSTNTFAGLWELKHEFFAYFLSFFVIYNIWNSNHNLFIRINKLSNSIVWIMFSEIFILSFLPYVSVMVSEHFDVFFAQACFGMIFVLLHINYMIQSKILKRSDPANIALILYLDDTEYPFVEFILFIVVYILGYLYYPPIIMLGCLMAMILWVYYDQYLHI
ncbi:DUF1211 domain-containing membrane protein [Methanobrevibacter sp. 87.7]|uniref:TMEM175 family protein n=1 Tax=Methanobrevibacter sp. 87.7 TaxID=387957 RepID=UPI000B5001DF|nr:TMEM175 family protein [Methanobrevibacter sp. 87.7]OWT33506.1 DUF1211 domain-containing membrane protein [Methanobrevibacter sp. 87.7]